MGSIEHFFPLGGGRKVGAPAGHRVAPMNTALRFAAHYVATGAMSLFALWLVAHLCS